jgi:hypothetical protein
MITTKQTNDVLTHGMNAPSNFQIKASGKAFAILTSNLYTHKIHAILRELGCNAIDAHVDVGTPDMPFKVYLPTTLYPEFKIRDFGTGISENDIGKVYTVLFESTKDQNNNAIGCLGLGSKTPFSYTSSFIVKSYQGGIVKTYSMYLSEDGCPCYVKVGEKETDEENGLAVQFAVEKYDICQFHDAAKDIYKWFSVKPEIVNVTIDFDMNLNITHEGSNYKIFTGICDSCLVMGNISYPLSKYRKEINSKIYQDDTINKDYKLICDFLSSHKIIGYVPIGFFDIAPSREEMSLDKVSVENITSFILECLNDYKNLWKKGLEEIFNEESYFTACVKFANYNDGILKLFNDLTTDCIHVKSGKPLNLSVSIIDGSEDRKIKCYIINNRGNGNYSMSENFQGAIHPRYFVGENAIHKFFVRKDDSKSVIKRIRHYLLNTCSPTYNSHNYKVFLLEEKDVIDFAEEYDIPLDMFNDIESLPIPSCGMSLRYSNYNPKEGRVTGSSVRGDVAIFSGGKFVMNSEDAVLEKDMDNVFYSSVSNDCFKIFDEAIRVSSSRASDFYDVAGVDEDEDLYIIRLKTESSLNKVLKWDCGWKNVESFLKDKKEEWKDIVIGNNSIKRMIYSIKNGVGSTPDFIQAKMNYDPIKDVISKLEGLLIDDAYVPKIFKNMSEHPIYIPYGHASLNSVELVRKDRALKNVFGAESDEIMSIYLDKHPELVIKMHKEIKDIIINTYKLALSSIIFDDKIKENLKSILQEIERVDEENEENEENLLTKCA